MPRLPAASSYSSQSECAVGTQVAWERVGGLCTAHLHCQRQGLVPAEWEVGVGTLGCQVVGYLGIETWKEYERT